MTRVPTSAGGGSGTALLLERLRCALRPPGARDGLELLAAALAYAVLVAPAARRAGLFDDAPPADGPGAVLAARVLVAPALLEEVLFRVLANPHPDEGAGRGRVVGLGALSLAAYVASHPLAARARPSRSEGFARPAFLGACGLLGLGCLLLYRRSGSLWPPVLLHGAVVTAWLRRPGGGRLSRRRRGPPER